MTTPRPSAALCALLLATAAAGCDAEDPAARVDYRAIGHVDIGALTSAPWMKDALKDGKLEVDGKLTIHGITKTLSATAHVSYLEGAAEKRNHGQKGDLLVIRSSFEINRKDFEVGGDVPLVADKIELRMALVGLNPAS